MPSAVVEEVCTITAKEQTIVSKAVRQALGVGYGGRIAFQVARGRVTVHALPPEQDGEVATNPALAPFLALLGAAWQPGCPGCAPASEAPHGPPESFGGRGGSGGPGRAH